ncbi:uncharacterized protein TNCV_10741 [Trichonephila clavipes]|nr:uncharacterized protein TNCV_10741 [Trichonephila clavipes]
MKIMTEYWVANIKSLRSTVLIDQMPPAMLNFYPDGKPYFMDKNPTIPCTRSVLQNWLVEHQSDFQHIHWSPHNPYLNHVENVWGQAERYPRQHSSLSLNLHDLKDCIVNLWYSLDVNALLKHADSMQKRIRAVICVKGGPIKY